MFRVRRPLLCKVLDGFRDGFKFWCCSKTEISKHTRVDALLLLRRCGVRGFREGLLRYGPHLHQPGRPDKQKHPARPKADTVV